MLFIIRSSNTFNKSEIFKLIQPSQPYLSGRGRRRRRRRRKEREREREREREKKKKKKKKKKKTKTLDATEQTQKRGTS